MTLLITWASDESIVQVSDTRLSYGTWVEDVAQKCLCLATADAFCVVGYSGLAEIKESPGGPVDSLEDWIAKEVEAMPPRTLLIEVVRRLTARLDEAVEATCAHWPEARPLRPTTVTLAGYPPGEGPPLFVCISNHLEFGHTIEPRSGAASPLRVIDKSGKPSFVLGDFRCTFGAKGPGTASLLAHGNVSAIEPFAYELWRTARKIADRGPLDRAIARLLVSTMRRAGSAGPGRNISPDCYSVVLRRGSRQALAGAHNEADRVTVKVLPRLIGPGHGFGPAFLVPNRVPAAVLDRFRERFMRGDFAVRLDEDSLAAYLELSPRVQQWVSFISGMGTPVSSLGLVQRAVAVARAGEVRTIARLDQALRSADGWGRRFFTHYLHEAQERSGGRTTLDRQAVVTLLLIAGRPARYSDPHVRRVLEIPDRLLDTALRYGPQ